MLVNVLRRQLRQSAGAGRVLSVSASTSSHMPQKHSTQKPSHNSLDNSPNNSPPALAKYVKQAKEVHLKNTSSMSSPYLGGGSHLSLELADNVALTARDVFKLGEMVHATVRKTHLLGVLMTVTASPPAQQQQQGLVVQPEAQQQSESVDGEFIGLVTHMEIDFYRKSTRKDLRLDTSYPMFVQNLTDEGLLRLSFRPGVRDRRLLCRDAVLEALEMMEDGRIAVGEASSAEEVRAVFFGVSKSDFKIALGALYKEHRIEKPAGRAYTQMTSEETRLALLQSEERQEQEHVTVSLQNLPLDIKTATLAQHVMAHLHTAMRRGGGEKQAEQQKEPEKESVDGKSAASVATRAPLQGIEMRILQLSLRTREARTYISGGEPKERPASVSALLRLAVEGKASRLDSVAQTQTPGQTQKQTQKQTQGQTQTQGQAEEKVAREAGLSRLVVRLLTGLDIGKKVTVQPVAGTSRQPATE